MSGATAKKTKPGGKRAASAKSPAPEKAPRQPAKVVRLTAADMAEKQREISVSEFFTKNRHLLGFDSPAKALLTT
ncbi:MAG: DNA topoisomerase VI subunit B, partial [Candidatus Eisenbacteria bacterium]